MKNTTEFSRRFSKILENNKRGREEFIRSTKIKDRDLVAVECGIMKINDEILNALLLNGLTNKEVISLREGNEIDFENK